MVLGVLALLVFSYATKARILRSAGLTSLPNCATARALGIGQIYRWEPGYGPHLDRDNDGVACEPMP
ncbi:MAG TPA: excalibur calcium-binding domain-containing protein [Caulobacteraceae bacterium]|nr:excalibur calcium-binding domain-containing protein [Caulobacteraceae bacterium]